MRAFPIAILLAGCARVPPPACPEPAVPVVAPVAAVEPNIERDDAAVIAHSRAFFEAVDKRDLGTFQGAAGPTLVLFELGRFLDTAFLVGSMQAGLDRKAPPRTRTCKDEKVHRAANVAIYIGLCVENVPAHGENPSSSVEGWNTLVWVPDGASWKVAHWGWQQGGVAAERDRWNVAYKSSANFKRTPNQLLIDTVTGRKPGTALDLAMGQGRNAIFLASQGWKVSGIDISDEGLRIANETAAEQKLKIVTIRHDMETFDYGVKRYDLVSMIYAGDDPKLIAKIKVALKKGGLFVAEYFHEDSTTGTDIGGFATGELAKLFTGWTIIKDEVVDDIADWGQRKTKLVRFVAQKK